MERSPAQLGVGSVDLTAREFDYVQQVLQSKRLSYGPFSRKFEQEFARRHDCGFGVFVNSGTSALSIAVACLKEVGKWREGDEILVPAVTFVATVNVLLEHGLTPVFVDCHPRTYTIDPAQMEAKITPRTRGVMVVHLCGLMADMDLILAVATKHDLTVIEDSCETVGAQYRGRTAGSLGAISCFSTYAAHIIVTGVGGFALTSDPHYAEILRSLANHGRDSIYLCMDDDQDIDGARFREIIRRRFRFIRRGYSFRATEMEAALGLAQLERLEEILRVRREHAQTLGADLHPLAQWLQLPWYDPTVQDHAFMMFPIVVREGSPFARNELVEHLEAWNVETRDLLPLINQPVYAPMHIPLQEYPVADWINRCGFYIGCHPGFSKEQLGYIVQVFREFFRERKLLP